VNASPLIFLTRVGLLEVLREPADEAFVPDIVVEEIDRRGLSDPAAAAIRSAAWLQVSASPAMSLEMAAWNLGAGETAVIGLALASPGSLVVIDDLAARRTARSLGISLLGTLALVGVAKAIGMIQEVRPILDTLRQTGMYVSDRLTRQVLDQAGE
jgi:predicted nucleic acid-binding protein